MKNISSLKRKLEKISKDISFKIEEGVITLSGEVDNYEKVIEIGKLASKAKCGNVVNDITVPGLKEKPMRVPSLRDNALDGKEVDVLIIGAGIVGCTIARELSKKKLKTLVLDKEYDVAVRTSSRNDGMIHPGIDIHPGMKKAEYNARGNRMYPSLSEELGFPFRRINSYVLFDKSIYVLTVPVFKIRGKQNHVDGVEFLSKKKIKERIKDAPSWQKGGMNFPSTGITSPYEATIAFAENAATNGVEFSFNSVVESMRVEKNKVQEVITNRGKIKAKVVVNASGVYSDKIAEMAKDKFFTIHPRKGTELILDKKASSLTDGCIAKVPFSDVKSHTKGGGVMRTIHGNILVGPDAVETSEREDDSTESSHIDAIIEKHQNAVPGLRKSDVITYFSGTRSCTYEEDFIIEKGRKTKNIVHAAGIQSPGLTAAPAIAEDVSKMVVEILKDEYSLCVEDNPTFNGKREKPIHVNELNEKERDALIKKNPDYGKIVCRCEEVSKGEILDALRSPLNVDSLDAIKRRSRPGMGRCQGGFCSPLVASIISKEKGIPLSKITKGSPSSLLLGEENKESFKEDENV